MSGKSDRFDELKFSPMTPADRYHDGLGNVKALRRGIPVPVVLIPEDEIEHLGVNPHILAKALHLHDPAIQSLAKQHGEGNIDREKAIVAKAWERNEGEARDFYLKLAADVIAEMEKA